MLPHDDVGAGPPVVLLHAGVADRGMWADLLPAIAEAGYRAIAMDLPGHGDAPAVGAAPHSAVLDTMDALDVDRAVLVGNSFGGAVALRVAAVAAQRVAALALISAPAPGVEPSAELEAAWEAEESAFARGDIAAAVAAVVDTWTLPDAPPALRDRIAAMQRRAFELAARADDVPPAEDPLEPDSSALSTLDIPTLVAVGELDMADFRVGAEALVQQLRGARLVVLPKAGHLAPLEQPDAFRVLLLDYLRETGDRG
ncbi:alpha/beta fold hydrolase [Capillimicrobium parvum]|uniref:2-hydroxy-6-oxo-6-phenylhexa-2,4-dienoate hydrolase n=1 Tax=Capillimicrobium parvum TaxID=2884022 RepID=A0A9E6XVP3_9ACTN|nr:alpha/beta hydrolase [Capillimicrobium parvum]UGS34958.1 2-hydroxy-6-oxo-6-phenylhexa-2,4-dienoate hydrolase [Capillimicrobium parvum]